jgi:hypothetical protein
MMENQEHLGMPATAQSPLTTAKLVALANKDQLPKSLRDAVAASLGAPEAAENLRAGRDEVLDEPVADPFVRALRRIAWPSDRLPGRHRKAIAAVGQEPLAFVRLVVEEARTESWRAFSPDALAQVVQWIVPWAKDHGELDRLRLAARALGYRNLVASYTIIVQDHEKLRRWNLELAAFMKVSDDRWPSLLEAEAYMSMEILSRYAGYPSLEDFDVLMAHMMEDSDSRMLLGFMEGFLANHYGPGENAAVEAFMRALEHRDADSDPWLEFFLRFYAARVLVTASLRAVPDLEGLARQILAADATPAGLRGKVLREPQMRVIHQFQSDLEAEYRERREPALRHLEAIERLFHEFRTPEIAVQYYCLLVECLRAYESHQALDYCCDAVLAAEEQDPGDLRIGVILWTAVVIRKFSREFERTPLEVRDSVYRRVGQILYPRFKARMKAAGIGGKEPALVFRGFQGILKEI